MKTVLEVSHPVRRKPWQKCCLCGTWLVTGMAYTRVQRVHRTDHSTHYTGAYCVHNECYQPWRAARILEGEPV